MKQISAEVIAHSKNPMGDEIISLIATIPRFILAELNTHRAFSKNSASSRAVPAATMIQNLKDDSFYPIAWQKDHRGMQGIEYIEGNNVHNCKQKWLEIRNQNILYSDNLNSVEGVTKQLTNRLLEPFMWHTVIITATEWENFFNLRCPQYVYDEEVFKSRREWLQYNYHLPEGRIKNYIVPVEDTDWLKINKGQAEIHMMALAEAIYDAKNESKAAHLTPGEWHIPFGDRIDEDKLIKLLYKLNNDTILINGDIINQAKIEIATARCARVSYLNYEGKDDYEADLKLYHKLRTSGSSSAFHASPFEHCAKTMSNEDYDNYLVIENGKTIPGVCRNFKGFIQLRSLIEQ